MRAAVVAVAHAARKAEVAAGRAHMAVAVVVAVVVVTSLMRIGASTPASLPAKSPCPPG